MTVADLQTNTLKQICSEYRVIKLYAFGSVVHGELHDSSDLDFLVEFERDGTMNAFDQFMGFKEALELLFSRPVDLLTVREFRNPYFKQELERTQTLIYAA